MDKDKYHLRELEIARSPGDPRRIMPPILESYRRILDVGCGAGQTLIASNIAPQVEAVGLDVDHSALRLGSQLEKKIHFVCAKGEALPFPNEHFDFVYSRVALPYMHLQKTLAEMWRVLCSGGSIWVVLHPLSITLKDMIRSLFRLEIKGTIHCLYVMTNGAVIHFFGTEVSLPFRNEQYESFQTVRGVSRLLKGLGFEDIKISKSNFFVATARKTDHHADLSVDPGS